MVSNLNFFSFHWYGFYEGLTEVGNGRSGYQVSDAFMHLGNSVTIYCWLRSGEVFQELVRIYIIY